MEDPPSGPSSRDRLSEVDFVAVIFVAALVTLPTLMALLTLMGMFPMPLRGFEETLEEHRELAEHTDVAPDGATVVAAVAAIAFAPSDDVGPAKMGPGPGTMGEGCSMYVVVYC